MVLNYENVPERIVVFFGETSDLLKRSDDQADGSQLSPRIGDLVLVERESLRNDQTRFKPVS